MIAKVFTILMDPAASTFIICRWRSLAIMNVTPEVIFPSGCVTTATGIKMGFLMLNPVVAIRVSPGRESCFAAPAFNFSSQFMP